MEKQRHFKMNRDISVKLCPPQKTIQLFQEPPRELFVWSPKQKAENNLLKFNQDKSSIYYPVCLWGHLLLSHKQWRGWRDDFSKPRIALRPDPHGPVFRILLGLKSISGAVPPVQQIIMMATIVGVGKFTNRFSLYATF